MKVVFSARGWDDYAWWQQPDRKLLKRINDEHRLVYWAADHEVRIAACRYHYER